MKVRTNLVPRDVIDASELTEKERAMESQPMKQSELGRYVCVAHGGCLRTPHTTIMADGVWVKAGQQWSSAHRDCFNAWQARERQPVDKELFERTAPKWNCVDYPNDGMHYVPHGDCVWCGMTQAEIAQEHAIQEGE